ncbi:protein of unknown function [Magnetospira sp. QH-2]|nr:protein of unknown function [Magnetospira sp. QH-2]
MFLFFGRRVVWVLALLYDPRIALPDRGRSDANHCDERHRVMNSICYRRPEKLIWFLDD